MLEDYIQSVKAQSIHRHPPSHDDIAGVFSDLVLAETILDQVGQAIQAGHGFFLYGDSGNGKTSLAERVSRAFGQTIWIPRSLSVGGLIVRLYDPCNHVEVPPENKNGLYDQLKIDRRWIRIRRPTIIVGGELTMESLELQHNPYTKITEPSVQLKSNLGTLVIDDFGRQRMEPVELLNRWIVPLEKRHDYLSLSTGTKIEVPFDQLIIFSTNLEPRELVDEAFLRRIPYKINVGNPSEGEFRELMRMMAAEYAVDYRDDEVSAMIEKHYTGANRNFRCCHPRDLILQIVNYAAYNSKPVEMSAETFDVAVDNYFAVM